MYCIIYPSWLTVFQKEEQFRHLQVVLENRTHIDMLMHLNIEYCIDFKNSDNKKCALPPFLQWTWLLYIVDPNEFFFTFLLKNQIRWHKLFWLIRSIIDSALLLTTRSLPLWLSQHFNMYIYVNIFANSSHI